LHRFDRQDPIHRLAQSLRRRCLTLLIIEEGALAATFWLGATAVLIAAGGPALSWGWLAAGVISVAAGTGWRVRRRLPSSYRLLQQADKKFHTHDALSTAWYFAEMAQGRRSESEVVKIQRAAAENLARAADAGLAVPYRVPRTVYAATAALVAAGSLFAWRYGAERWLALEPPAVRAAVDVFRPTEEMIQAWQQSSEEPEANGAERNGSDSARRDGTGEDSRRSGIERSAAAVANGEVSDVRSSNGEERAGKPDGQAPEETASSSFPEGPEAESAAEAPNPEDDFSPSPPENDLLRKMQDAFAKLLNKLDLDAPKVTGRRMLAQRRSAAEASRRPSRQKRGAPSDGSLDGEGSPAKKPNNDASSRAGQTMASVQSDGQPEPGGQPGQKGAQNAAGRRDGAKKTRLAEQFEAMGKLAEILGRRAEHLKGDIMVEVSSGPQQLQTPYSETEATHRDPGAEIHRDEIPLELQPFVERYFREIHREAARAGGTE